MSKRDTADAMRDGFSIYLSDLRDMGYLPEAVVNWSALMGWSYDDRTEFFAMPELIEKFSLNRLNPSPAAINFSKLDHFNGLHIRRLEVADLAERIKPFLLKAGYEVDNETLLHITPLLQERMVTLEDAVEVGGFFFEEGVSPDPGSLVGKNMTPGESAEVARRAYQVLAELPRIDHEAAEGPLRALAEELGISAGQLFSILRTAVTGRNVSPPLLQTMAVVGKETVLERLQNAIKMLEKLDE